ncbi:MAG: hypothetical protein FWF02_04070 [Micrococcales bacterium]|nr:hypothetical protein [Micrococcales bacterium]MCL2666867.1 hypothetical protein [Micrococcales bacterium]
MSAAPEGPPYGQPPAEVLPHAAGGTQDVPEVPAWGTPEDTLGVPTEPLRPIRSSPGWDEVRSRNLLLAFDGRVLEIFGELSCATEGKFSDIESMRFHVGVLALTVLEDEKTGRYRVELGISNARYSSRRATNERKAPATGNLLSFNAEEWVTVGPFFSRVAAAALRWDARQNRAT